MPLSSACRVYKTLICTIQSIDTKYSNPYTFATFCNFVTWCQKRWNLSIQLKFVKIWALCSDYRLESSWQYFDKLCTPGFEGFLPSQQILSTSSRLDGDCQWTAIFSTPQRCFNSVQVRALAGPLKDIHRVVPKPIKPGKRFLFAFITYNEVIWNSK